MLTRLVRTVRIGGPLSLVRAVTVQYQLRPCTDDSRPVPQLLLLVSLLGATLATVRQKIISSVRACQCCHGYGIQRCAASLCCSCKACVRSDSVQRATGARCATGTASSAGRASGRTQSPARCASASASQSAARAEAATIGPCSTTSGVCPRQTSCLRTLGQQLFCEPASCSPWQLRGQLIALCNLPA